MKTRTKILIGCVVALSALWLARRPLYQFVVTDRLNAELGRFSLRDLQGNPVESGDYTGKILVLDFWTTWCGACRRALPDFQQIFDCYSDNAKVAFLAVNTSQGGDSMDKVRAFVQSNSYTFPVAYDAGAILSTELGIKYYPTLIIVDKSGNMRIRHIGYSKSLEDYKAMLTRRLEALLQESK